MKAIKKNGYLYDPPSWMVCPDCHNGHFPYPASDDGDVGWGRCPTCGGTGLLPIRYTPEEWIDAGGILTNDTPVWVPVTRVNNIIVRPRWEKASYHEIEEGEPGIIIATTAGPPEEERK